MEKQCTAGQATDNNMAPRIACWTPKATRTHSEYVILIAFLLQQWLQDCASVLRYTNIGCLAFHVITYPTHGMSYPIMTFVLMFMVYLLYIFSLKGTLLHCSCKVSCSE